MTRLKKNTHPSNLRGVIGWPALAIVLILLAFLVYSVVPRNLTSPDKSYRVNYPHSWSSNGGFSNNCSFDKCVNTAMVSATKNPSDSNSPYATLTLIKSDLSAKQWFSKNIILMDVSAVSSSSSTMNGYDTYYETDIDGGTRREATYVVSHKGLILYIYSTARLGSQGLRNLLPETKITKSIRFNN